MLRTLLSLVAALALFTPLAHGQASRTDALTMGNPSNAKADPLMKTNYLIKRNTNSKYGTSYSPALYYLSYNNDTLTPNWGAWHLSKAWLGAANRTDDFRADDSLPTGFTKLPGSGYDGSGFDRGHLCPSEARSASVDQVSATFFMTNMMPQSSQNNGVCWKAMEEYCRKLANDGNEMYIVCGPYGHGGTGDYGFDDWIPNKGTYLNKVKVPSHTWKVVLVLPNGTSDLSRVDVNTRCIGVMVPNDKTPTSDWGKYRVTVRSIEQLTGHNFHRLVAQNIQDAIETKLDAGPTK